MGALLLLPASAPAAATYNALWLEFAHPDQPHTLEIYSVPVCLPELFPKSLFPNLPGTWDYKVDPLRIPMFITLLRFQNLVQSTSHTPAFFADLAFNLNRSQGPTGRPSFAEMMRENSNGRLEVYAASAGEDITVTGSDRDGVSEWNTAAQRTVCDSHGCGGVDIDCDGTIDEATCRTRLRLQAAAFDDVMWRFWGAYPYYQCHDAEKRQQAIIQADALFSYSHYNDNSPSITSRELIVLPIQADRRREEHADHADPVNDVIGDWAAGANPLNAIGNAPDPLGGHAVTVSQQVDNGAATVSQMMGMYPEQAAPDFWFHELGHALFATEDLYQPYDWQMDRTGTGYYHQRIQRDANGDAVIDASGNVVMERVKPGQPECPPAPDLEFVAMGGSEFQLGGIRHFTPWTKIHLGFVLPKVVTHDGTYRIYDAETVRSYAEQKVRPEVLLIYDPLDPSPYEKYFALEVRNAGWLTKQGLAVWLVDERLIDDKNDPSYAGGGNYSWDMLRANRLLIRDGFWTAADGDFGADHQLWDGSNDDYDLTPTSTPRDTNWLDLDDGVQTDAHRSYIEITDISAIQTNSAMPGESYVEVTVRMPPIFADVNTSIFSIIGCIASGVPVGSEDCPYASISDAIAAIPQDGYRGMTWHPRTIRIKAGTYLETSARNAAGVLVINDEVTLMPHGNGAVVIGE